MLGAYSTGGWSQPPSRQTSNVEQVWQEAQTAQKQQRFDEAIQLYKKVLKLQPNLFEAELNLGLMYQVTDNLPDAIAQFKKVLGAKPGTYAANLFSGLDYLKLGKPENALPFLTKAVQEAPGDGRALVGLANSNLQLQNYEVARKQFQDAIATDRRNADAWYGLGATYLSLEQQAEIGLAKSANLYRTILRAQSSVQADNAKLAVEALEAPAVKSANVPCGAALLGFAYLANGETAKAETAFRADWDDNAKTGCLLGKVGLAALDARAHNNGRALEQIREAAAIDAPAVAAAGDWLRPYLDNPQQLAQTRAVIEDSPRPAAPDRAPEALMESGRYTACTKALAGDVSKLTVSQKLLLSTCAFFAGQNAVVLDATTGILQARPNDEAALFWRVQALDRLGLESLSTATEINPDSVSLHMMYAGMQRSQLRFPDAAEEYRKAIVLNPAYMPAHLGMAYCLFFQKRLEEAEHETELVLHQEKADGEANLLMGKILIRRNEADRALPYLKAALNVGGSQQFEAHSELSRIYQASGNTDAAIQELQKAVRGDSDGSLYYRLGRLLKESGHDSEALQAFAESKRLRGQSETSGASVDQ